MECLFWKPTCFHDPKVFSPLLFEGRTAYLPSLQLQVVPHNLGCAVALVGLWAAAEAKLCMSAGGRESMPVIGPHKWGQVRH
jgi:hypothetical protein